MNEATTAELQNLRQGIGEVIEERHKQIHTIVGEQQKQINDVNNSLTEILKILQSMKSKRSSENGSDTDWCHSNNLFSGFPPSAKTNISKFQFDLETVE